MLNGVDISVDQGDIDFAALKGSVAWVHAKATEGITYQDSMFRTYHDGAKAVGIPFGAYHFFRGNDDGVLQAQNFLVAIDGYEGNVLPMVDCEEDGRGGVDRETFLRNLSAFISHVDVGLNGKRMLIYFMYSFWTDFLGGYDGFSGHPAWPAAYNNDGSLDMTGTGWKDWTIWQYSNGSGLSVPGIAGGVDHDRLNGDNLAVILRA